MLCDNLTIIETTGKEMAAIRAIHEAAFATPAEASLVEALLDADTTTISLMALCDGKPAGHILLSEIGAPIRAAALAPLAVLGTYREMGAGSALVRAALEKARELGFAAIFVLGDPAYYERFGFKAGLARGFDVPWKGRHFMALELEEDALSGKVGKLDYPAAFFS